MRLTPPPSARDPSRNKLVLIVGIAGVMAILVLLHVRYVNGPWFWFWPWRREAPGRTYATMLLAAIPLIVAHVVHHKCRIREAYLLPLLMITSYAMMLANIVAPTHPASLDLLRDAVRSPYAMSYYTDAAALQQFDGWLAQYPQLLPQLSMHTQSKPAGPLLFFTAFIRVMGYNDHTAIVSGLCIGLLSTFSVAASYWLIKLLSGNREAGFMGASLLAICPGYVLSFPLFDPAYIILTAALVGLWILALSRDRIRFSALLGLTAGAMLIVSYTLLIVGAFMVGYALVCTSLPPRRAIARGARHAAIAIVICAAALCLFWMLTGYNAPEAFHAALINQQRLVSADGGRTWPRTIPFDLWDFALGSGWVIIPLAGFGLQRAWRARGWKDPLVRILAMSLAMPLLTALTGLLPLETSRVWNFELPFLLLPAGFELMHWRTRDRWIVVGCVWLASATISQNLWIVLPWV